MPRPTAPLRLSIHSVSRRIHPLFEGTREGRVLATFTRSCYLELDGRIAALVAPELLNGPLNAVVDLAPSASFTDLPVGATIRVREGVLEIGDAWRLDLTRAQPWDARLPAAEIGQRTGTWLAAVERLLDTAAPRESFAGRGRPERAAAAMLGMARALAAADPDGVADAARRLAGLGPGLTPSGDDVLAGVLLAIVLTRPFGAQPQRTPKPQHPPDLRATTAGDRILRDAIMDAIRGRTTRISAAYLEAAADGEAGEAWHRLLQTMPDGGADLDEAVRRVLAFGETSGADMLAGLVLGMEAVTAA